MEEVYHLSDSPIVTALSPGKYCVSVLGGKSVILNNFRVLINYAGTKDKLPVNLYKRSIRTTNGVRCFHFEIEEYAEYEMVFRNPEELAVRKSLLFFMRFFQDDIPPKEIEIGVEKL
jgi:hypothetical protein